MVSMLVFMAFVIGRSKGLFQMDRAAFPAVVVAPTATVKTVASGLSRRDMADVPVNPSDEQPTVNDNSATARGSLVSVGNEPQEVDAMTKDELLAEGGATPLLYPEVGRPFPLSDSVRARCKSRWCVELALPRLLKFASERRDPVWAPLLEADIGDYIASRKSEGYSLRAVECRTSLCIAEVFSPDANVFYMRRIPEAVGEPTYLEFVDGFPETLPNYSEGTVTLLVFERHLN